MNFLNFLTAGASLLNFNLQNLASSSVTHPEKLMSDPEKLDNSPVESSILVQRQIDVLNQRQQLINQYMHLNIQLLSQKLQTLEKQPEEKMKEGRNVKDEDDDEDSKHPRKKTKKINKCGHQDKQHYAKGLCNNCYHKFGRNKKPWNCPHQKLYAAGMCQNCYINNYNRKKRLCKDTSQPHHPEQRDETEPKIEQNYSEIESQQREKQMDHP